MTRDTQDFISAYITCALWSTNDESTPQGGEPLDANYSDSDIAAEARAKMEADCLAFLAKVESLIDSDDPRLSSDGSGRYSHAGHDFWLTRNGHGAGFWDGDWPVHGNALTDLSNEFPEVNLCVGSDGKIHAY